MRAAFSAWSRTRTAITSGFGTRGPFGWILSIQTQTKPFGLPLLSTLNAKRSAASLAPGSDSAIRRTSSWLATFLPLYKDVARSRIVTSRFKIVGAREIIRRVGSIPSATDVPAATAATASLPRGATEGATVGASLLALAGAHFAVDCCTGIWPVFKTLAGLDIARAGLIATVGSMAGNGLQVAFGFLADRGWRRRLVVGGVCLAGAVTLVPFVVGSYLLMLALVLATQLGSAAFHPSATGAAGSLSRSRTGLMIGLFLSGGYVGYSLSQVVFSTVYRHSSTLTPVIALLPIGAAVAIARRGPGVLPAARTDRDARSLRRVPLRPLAPLFAAQVFTNAVSSSFIFLLPDFLLARGAPTWMVEGGGHFGLVAGGCLGILPAGHAADRFGARRVLLLANGASLLLLAVLLRRTGASAVDFALVTGFGAFNAMTGVVSVAEGNRLVPGQGSGVSALLMGLAWCVGALGPVTAGWLADPARGGTPAGALSWLALALPLALAASVGVRPRRS
jgi:FSR family fosmidomycin resistance protein-like MFS transporter